MKSFKATIDVGKNISFVTIFGTFNEALDFLIEEIYKEIGHGDGENGGMGNLENCENDIRSCFTENGGQYEYADCSFKLEKSDD